eukprot:751284-Hanusia_phi.AAC.1
MSAGRGDGDVLVHGEVEGEGVEVADAVNLLPPLVDRLDHVPRVLLVVLPVTRHLPDRRDVALGARLERQHEGHSCEEESESVVEHLAVKVDGAEIVGRDAIARKVARLLLVVASTSQKLRPELDEVGPVLDERA